MTSAPSTKMALLQKGGDARDNADAVGRFDTSQKLTGLDDGPLDRFHHADGRRSGWRDLGVGACDHAKTDRPQHDGAYQRAAHCFIKVHVRVRLPLFRSRSAVVAVERNHIHSRSVARRRRRAILLQARLIHERQTVWTRRNLLQSYPTQRNSNPRDPSPGAQFLLERLRSRLGAQESTPLAEPRPRALLAFSASTSRSRGAALVCSVASRRRALSRNFGNGAVERLGVCLRRRIEAGKLAHELQRGSMDFGVRGRGSKLNRVLMLRHIIFSSAPAVGQGRTAGAKSDSMAYSVMDDAARSPLSATCKQRVPDDPCDLQDRRT